MIEFGTDGIRGKFNQEITLDMALKLGEFLGREHRGNKILIGEDTRLSSPILAYTVATGIASMGCDVFMMGICPTPALAYTASLEKFSSAVMVSASHNPYYDNGLKVFNKHGSKISEELEMKISDYLNNDIKLEKPANNSLGRIIDYSEGIDHYIKHIEQFVSRDFSDLKIVLDCANGSAITTAKQAFMDLQADVIEICALSNGTNINENCGSTHLETIRKEVLRTKADLGFAFDGDADRCLAVDHEGNVIDGDTLLFILAKSLYKDGRLKQSTVVTTVMANLGFKNSCEALGLNVVITDVGDKHVYDEMYQHNYKLGGEQSGHIIMKDFATTGDGVLTALKIADIVVQTKTSLKDLASELEHFPQLLEKVVVEDKLSVMNHEDVQKKIKEINDQLGSKGRILVRPSGTEPVIRIMVEATSSKLCESHVNDMISVINNI